MTHRHLHETGSARHLVKSFPNPGNYRRNGRPRNLRNFESPEFEQDSGLFNRFAGNNQTRWNSFSPRTNGETTPS